MTQYQKFALLFGCDYPGTPFELSGCVNDANNVKSFLIEKRGFDLENIQTIYNQQMTKARMASELRTFALKTHVVAGTGKIPTGVLGYSGHGIRVSQNGNARKIQPHGVNDSDGDEGLVPYDVQTTGIFLDDDLFTNFIKRLHPTTQLFILTDCCNSGTNFDLAYEGTLLTNTRSSVDAKVIQLAAYTDPQFAMEINGHGVLTTKFLQLIGPEVEHLSTFRKVMADVSVPGNPQNPQVSISNASLLNGNLFPWLVRNETFGPLVVDKKAVEKAKAKAKAEAKAKAKAKLVKEKNVKAPVNALLNAVLNALVKPKANAPAKPKK
jgi:hypothetical protein